MEKKKWITVVQAYNVRVVGEQAATEELAEENQRQNRKSAKMLIHTRHDGVFTFSPGTNNLDWLISNEQSNRIVD